MRWFKHFEDSHESNRISKMVEEKGLECEARWFRLLALLTKELNLENKDAAFELHWKVIATKLMVQRKQTVLNLLSYWSQIGLIKVEERNSFVKIVCPTLWKLQDKDSKYNRKRIVSRSQSATLEEEVDKDLDYKKEITKVISKKEISNSLFDTVCQSWNDWSRDPFKPVMGIKSDTVRKFFEIVKRNPNLQFPENWVRCFTEIEKNNSLNGKNQLGFVASLQWLIEKEKIVDALNGSFQKSMSEQEIIREKNNSVENPYV